MNFATTVAHGFVPTFVETLMMMYQIEPWLFYGAVYLN